MKIDLNRRAFVLGATTAATAYGLGIPGAAAADPFKVGFVYVGPIGDFGWTHGHDLGRKDVEKAFGDKVKTTFVENVAEGPDADRVIRQLASTGHQLIFTTSFGFMNPTIRVAKRFPKVMFEHATGYQRANNVSIYNARFYEGRAVIGNIAGHMTETGKFGYIASFPIPEVVMGINAFILAARKIRPDAEIKVVWVNSWYDPGKEADAAKALIDQGCDVITQHTDSPAPIQVSEQRGVWTFGQASDMRNFAPQRHLTAILDIWGPYYVERVKAAMEGTWESSDIWWGLKEGLVAMAPYGDAVPENVRQDADAVRDGIIAGTLHPFAGPIKNQAGELAVKEGEQLTDEQLLKMDWYVEGVQA